MKAAVLSEVGGNLVVEDIPRPRPRAGEILVRVAGCGVCHTDLPRRQGRSQFSHALRVGSRSVRYG